MKADTPIALAVEGCSTDFHGVKLLPELKTIQQARNRTIQDWTFLAALAISDSDDSRPGIPKEPSLENLQGSEEWALHGSMPRPSDNPFR